MIIGTDIEMEQLSCDCGIVYAIQSQFIEARRDDHKTFYCPNGCNRYYPGESETEKLKRELKYSLQSKRYFEEKYNETELLRRAQKGQVTKIKNRIAKGVCPCCNRTFENLQNHMKTKHPNFIKANK